MYFAVMKLTFESGSGEDARDLKSLAEKIRSRFKVVAQAGALPPDGGALSLGIAALGGVQAKLSQKMDSIVDFCEESGFGRVETETTLLDHLDNLEDFEEIGDEETEGDEDD